MDQDAVPRMPWGLPIFYVSANIPKNPHSTDEDKQPLIVVSPWSIQLVNSLNIHKHTTRATYQSLALSEEISRAFWRDITTFNRPSD